MKICLDKSVQYSVNTTATNQEAINAIVITANKENTYSPAELFAKPTGINAATVGYWANYGLHASCEEFGKIAQLFTDHNRPCAVPVVITCGRDEFRKAEAAGSVGTLASFGVQFVNDTCWCMLTEPVIPPDARVIMTNSGKYAHYAPGLVGRSMRFGSLEDCIKAACGMAIEHSAPHWLVS